MFEESATSNQSSDNLVHYPDISSNENKEYTTETIEQSDSQASPKIFPHEMQMLYPKHIQKHINRKSLNMKRLIQTLKTPSKHSCGKEARRMSDLAKFQESLYYKLEAQSSNKKRRLMEEENEIQTELNDKGIDIENTNCDISKVFSLPVRQKTQKQKENPSPLIVLKQEQLQENDNEIIKAINFLEEDKIETPFREVVDFCCEEDISNNANDCGLIFKDIHNIQSYNEDTLKSTPQQKLNFLEKLNVEEKENEIFKQDDDDEYSLGYCHSFAKVFHDEYCDNC